MSMPYIIIKEKEKSWRWRIASVFMQNCETNRWTKNYLDKASLNNNPLMKIFMIADRKPRCAVFCFRHRRLHCVLCVVERMGQETRKGGPFHSAANGL